MKKILFIVTTLLVISSCAATRETNSSRHELRKEANLAKQTIIRKAVETRKFIIRFDRIYFSHGGLVDLVPRANYMIVDGEKAIINTAYLGRQYDIRPISGINMRGRTTEYNLEDDSSRGKYKLNMKVNNRSDSFDVFLTIGLDGSCNVSMSNIRIDNVRYSGHIVPLKEGNTKSYEENTGI